MKERVAPKAPGSRPRAMIDPRLRVLNSLRASAEMFRQQGKNPIEVQEALDWEKKLHERIAQIEAEQPFAKAA